MRRGSRPEGGAGGLAVADRGEPAAERASAQRQHPDADQREHHPAEHEEGRGHPRRTRRGPTAARPCTGIVPEEEPVLDHEIARDRREPERHQREVQPLQPHRGERDQHRDRRAGRCAAATRPSSESPPSERAHRPRADRHEHVLGEGHLARVAGEHHERQEDHREDEGAGGIAQVLLGDAIGRQRHGPDEHRPPAPARHGGWARPASAGRTRRPAASRACGRKSSATNRKIPGRLRPIRRQCSPSASANPLGALGNQNADPQLCASPRAMAPTKVSGRLRSLPEHRGAVRVHHEEGEGDRVEVRTRCR